MTILSRWAVKAHHYRLMLAVYSFDVLMEKMAEAFSTDHAGALSADSLMEENGVVFHR